MRMYSSERQMVVNMTILRLRESWWAWRDLSGCGPIHKFPQVWFIAAIIFLFVPPRRDWSGYNIHVGMTRRNSVNTNVGLLESARPRATSVGPIGDVGLFFKHPHFFCRFAQAACSVAQVLQAPLSTSLSPSPVSLWNPTPALGVTDDYWAFGP